MRKRFMMKKCVTSNTATSLLLSCKEMTETQTPTRRCKRGRLLSLSADDYRWPKEYSFETCKVSARLCTYDTRSTRFWRPFLGLMSPKRSSGTTAFRQQLARRATELGALRKGSVLKPRKSPSSSTCRYSSCGSIFPSSQRTYWLSQLCSSLPKMMLLNIHFQSRQKVAYWVLVYILFSEIVCDSVRELDSKRIFKDEDAFSFIENRTFIRRMHFKIQSSLLESDVLKVGRVEGRLQPCWEG